MCNDCFSGAGDISTNHLPVIGQEIADFEVELFQNEKIEKTHLSHYRGQWMVLFFYPADFTFVCPTELEELADAYEQFKAINIEIFSVSTDTVFAHKAWHDHSPAIKKVNYPMIADPTGELCREFGVYIDAEGVALRGTFVIDPDGVLQAYEVHANNIGRSAEELLRKVQAAQFVREHGGEVCPAKWKPGDKTLTPGLDLVGKI
jgi:peroxiredoxin (alkyl hydroperoxide reductase subunit C)